MKYKVGDKVLVRSDLKKTRTAVPEMVKLAGEIVTITDVLSRNDIYKIYEDLGYAWSEEMFARKATAEELAFKADSDYIKGTKDSDSKIEISAGWIKPDATTQEMDWRKLYFMTKAEVMRERDHSKSKECNGIAGILQNVLDTMTKIEISEIDYIRGQANVW